MNLPSTGERNVSTGLGSKNHTSMTSVMKSQGVTPRMSNLQKSGHEISKLSRKTSPHRNSFAEIMKIYQVSEKELGHDSIRMMALKLNKIREARRDKIQSHLEKQGFSGSEYSLALGPNYVI
jgi:DUF438 domain-containing protein